jgi:hypothetical protein
MRGGSVTRRGEDERKRGKERRESLGEEKVKRLGAGRRGEKSEEYMRLQ